MKIREIMTKDVEPCTPFTSWDAERRRVGIVSLHDLARSANGTKGGVRHADLVGVTQAIGQEYPTKTGTLLT